MKIYLILTVLAVLLASFAVVTFETRAGETNYEFTIYQAPRREAGPEAATQSPTSYLDNLYIWLLGMVGLAALAAIVYGGILYIFSGAIESTAEARRWITNAIIGLILAAISYLILRTINPELVRKFDVEGVIRKGVQRLR